MSGFMAPSKVTREPRATIAAPPSASAEVVARQVRVEELRRLVAKGAYQVDPRRMALRIFVKAMGRYSPEKRT
jgi:anti-sigma28 factor (negative regulator of flagellin synthesis)